MTRFKQELRERGYILECDYDLITKAIIGLKKTKAFIEDDHIIIKWYHETITVVDVYDNSLYRIDQYQE